MGPNTISYGGFCYFWLEPPELEFSTHRLSKLIRKFRQYMLAEKFGGWGWTDPKWKCLPLINGPYPAFCWITMDSLKCFHLMKLLKIMPMFSYKHTLITLKYNRFTKRLLTSALIAMCMKTQTFVSTISSHLRFENYKGNDSKTQMACHKKKNLSEVLCIEKIMLSSTKLEVLTAYFPCIVHHSRIRKHHVLF